MKKQWSDIIKVMKFSRNKLEKKADTLLQQLVKKLYPRCEVCGNETQCGHHFIEKSKSNRLRYELINIIPVCRSCHSKIHNRFSYSLGAYDIIDFIIKKKGRKWFNKLQKLRHELVKTDEAWYLTNIKNLEEKL